MIKSTLKQSITAIVLFSSLITSTNVIAKGAIEETTPLLSLMTVKEKAEAGDAIYQLKLVQMYLHGKDTPIDTNKAMYWITESAKTLPEGKAGLGLLYLKGEVVDRDEQKGLELLNKSLEESKSAYLILYFVYSDLDNTYGVTNHSKSLDMLEKYLESEESFEFPNIGSLQFMLANRLLVGYRVKADYDRAFPWLLKSAENHTIGALENLPRVYRYGLGTQQNYKQAFFSQKKAVDLVGRDSSIIELSAMYYCGLGTEQDIEKAEILLESINEDPSSNKYRRRAIACHDVGKLDQAKLFFEKSFYEENYQNGPSAFSLGYLLQQEQNYTKAFEWYSKGTEKGSNKARTNLALLYILGQGTEKDYQKAKQLLEVSIKNGVALAINNIGDMYENGYGVPIDYDKAKEYYLKAVEEEEPSGYASMGNLYQLGRGVEQNLDIAKNWYQQACDKGLPQGCEAISKLPRE